ncbi:MAG: glycosyl hydrolase family 8 [Pseudomonadota bacterium]
MLAGAAMCAVGTCVGLEPSQATPAFSTHERTAATIYPHEWAPFRHRYITPEGRVVDREKDGVSHSESQSYGLLLAVKANDQPTFDRILDFTFSEMRVRRDELVSWLYEPGASPAVTDRNNASDGDVMVAYALLKAAMAWDEPRYVSLAKPIVDDIGRLLLTRQGDHVILRPAAFGFDRGHHQDGPVLNLSYFIYGALLKFETISPRHPFREAWQSGLQLTQAAVSAYGGHAPDWVTLRSERFLEPAEGFKPHSSYDAVRIPLFMLMGGHVPREFLVPFDQTWNVRGSNVPVDVNLATRRAVMAMNEPGYRAIAALTACAVRGVPIPSSVQRFRLGTYFSSALHLMALSTARTYMPQCVGGRTHMGSQRAVPTGERVPTIRAASARERSPRRLTLDEMPGFDAPLAPREVSIAHHGSHFSMR